MSFKICVSGAAEGDCVNEQTMAKAETVGEAIAKAGAILVTGATTGIPHAAAKGVKRAKGISIGFSPAASRTDHMNRRPNAEAPDVIGVAFGPDPGRVECEMPMIR